MKVAILQRAEQNQAWEDQSASLDSDQVSEWSKEVERWENDHPSQTHLNHNQLVCINKFKDQYSIFN